MFCSCFGNDLKQVIYILGLSFKFNVSPVIVIQETIPPKKEIAEEKFSEILEEAIQPIKDSLKKLITHENVDSLLN